MKREILAQEVETRERELTGPSKRTILEDEVKEAKVVIGIPAFNSEGLLESTVRPLWGFADGIFVCDDGSTDLTSQGAKALGCKVIAHPQNSGYFSSICSLLLEALNTNADVLVIVDPGTQCRGIDIENLARPIVFENYDVVLGVNEAQEKKGSEYIIATTTKNRSKDMVEEERHFPLKAYSKNAMLELIQYGKGLVQEKERQGLGLKIKKYPVSYYNIAEEVGITIQLPKRRSIVVVNKVASRAMSLASTVSSIFHLKTSKALGNTWVLRKKLLTNIWFLRSLCLISGIIISGLLLTYSFIFINTYLTFGNTTSYFPWSWGLSYTAAGIVAEEFVTGVGISLATISACGFALWFVFIPRARISLTNQKAREIQIESLTKTVRGALIEFDYLILLFAHKIRGIIWDVLGIKRE